MAATNKMKGSKYKFTEEIDKQIKSEQKEAPTKKSSSEDVEILSVENPIIESASLESPSEDPTKKAKEKYKCISSYYTPEEFIWLQAVKKVDGKMWGTFIHDCVIAEIEKNREKYAEAAALIKDMDEKFKGIHS